MECKACTWRKCLGRGRPHYNGWNKPPTGCCAMHKQGAADDKCSHPFPPIKRFPKLSAYVWNDTQLWKAFNTLKVSLWDIFGEKRWPKPNRATFGVGLFDLQQNFTSLFLLHIWYTSFKTELNYKSIIFFIKRKSC